MKHSEKLAESKKWFESLDLLEQSDIRIAYNKLAMIMKIGLPPFENFILKCWKIAQTLENPKYEGKKSWTKKMLAKAGKAGKQILDSCDEKPIIKKDKNSDK